MLAAYYGEIQGRRAWVSPAMRLADNRTANVL
jgi:hypothetical protein